MVGGEGHMEKNGFYSPNSHSNNNTNKERKQIKRNSTPKMF